MFYGAESLGERRCEVQNAMQNKVNTNNADNFFGMA